MFISLVQRDETIAMHRGEENLDVLHISDLHLPFSSHRLKKIRAMVDASRPDLIVMTGDYIDHHKSIPIFVEWVREMTALCPIYFILGNHDIRFEPILLAQLDKVKNCNYVGKQPRLFISPRGFRYQVSAWDLKNDIQSDDHERHIVLIHNPERIDGNDLEGIDLILAGHIHGGQFIFWKTRDNTFFPGNILYNYCCDRKEIDQTTVIISKGLGDVLPLRLNCPYELVKIRII